MKNKNMENWKERWTEIRKQVHAEINQKGVLNNVELICRIHAHLFNHRFVVMKCGFTIIEWVLGIDKQWELEQPKKRKYNKKK